jgi:hypothetical protein
MRVERGICAAEGSSEADNSWKELEAFEAALWSCWVALAFVARQLGCATPASLRNGTCQVRALPHGRQRVPHLGIRGVHGPKSIDGIQDGKMRELKLFVLLSILNLSMAGGLCLTCQ